MKMFIFYILESKLGEGVQYVKAVRLTYTNIFMYVYAYMHDIQTFIHMCVYKCDFYRERNKSQYLVFICNVIV